MVFLSILALAMTQTDNTSPFLIPAGKQVAQVVPGGLTILPNGRYLTPVGKRLYAAYDLWRVVASPDGKSIVGFDEEGLTVFRDGVRKPIPFKGLAPAATYLPNGSALVVSLGEKGSLGFLNPETFALESEIQLNVHGVHDSYAVDVAISPDGKTAYCLDVANQDLLTIDLTKKELVNRVKAGREPYALALSPDGKRAYVANIGLFDYEATPDPAKGKGNPRGYTRPPFGYPSKEATEGVEFEGRKVAGLGDPRTPDADSVFLYQLDGAKPKLLKKAKSGLLIHAPADGGKSCGASAPNSLLLHGNLLYVSNGNNDTLSVFDAKTLALKQTIKLTPTERARRLRGVIPSAMAVNKTGTRVYVCESGLNAVGVIDTKTGKVLGHIPTGWFPNSIVAPQTGGLLVGTQKGLGRGPQGPLNPRPQTDDRYGLDAMPGMIASLAEPTLAELKQHTQTVIRNNGLIPVAQKPVKRPPIKYVVFITKENHTYDGIFGELKGANGQPEYAEFGMNGWIREKGKDERVPIMPNHVRLAEQFGISDNFYMEPQASGDGHRWLVGVYPSFWSTRVYYAGWDFRKSNTAKGRLTSYGSNGSQIPEDYLENGSIWEHLDRGGITFRNYGEGFEFPAVDEGPAGARSGGFEQANFPMPISLYKNTCFEYPIFNMNIPDIARVDWFKEDVAKTIRAKGKKLPQFINIALCNDHGAEGRPKDGYPYTCSFMADNDLALGRTVEYLSHTPEWKNMAIFVTQDDSGGDNDHVDRHRSFVLCISPWVKRGYVGHDHTSIMSVIRTIYETFGLGPNNMFDATAQPLWEFFTDKPDYTPYTAVNADPRVFKPEATLDPTDPEFKRRRLRPNVRLDDADFIEKMRRGSQKADD